MNIQAEYAIRIALSFICSFILGLERKSHQHTVGIRTLVLMGISTALLSILSIFMAESPLVKGDPTRIAAGVITGIGFLGGGAILKHGLNIRGLTTAAIIFTTSAIGMSFGAGLYIPSVITFLITILTLFTVDKLEKRFFPAAKTKLVVVQFSASDDVSKIQEDFLQIMKNHGLIVHDVNSKFMIKENLIELSYTVKTPDKLDGTKISQEFRKSTENLICFSIADK